MAISLEMQQDLMSTIVGIFDGAPTFDILSNLADRLIDGATVAQLADELSATQEFKSVYGNFLTSEQYAAKFVSSLLGNNVTAEAKALAVEYVAGQINGGDSFGLAAYKAINVLRTASEDDPTWGEAVKQLNNKVEVATTFAITTDFSGLSMEQLQSVTADVDATEQSKTDKLMLISAGILDAESETQQRLTTGQDFIKGTSLGDLFNATYFDNQNTLQSGDEISGGAGTDTLFARIGNSAEFAINAFTDSVEVAKFQAQAIVKDTTDNEIPGDQPATNEQGDNNYDFVVHNDLGWGSTGAAAVDAQNMVGTEEFWSTDSRADLVIEDVRNKSHETTLVMQNTDSGDVDYAVYFDDQHITAPGAVTADSQLYLEILDLEGMANGTGPLTNNPYVGIKISVGGEVYEIVGDSAITTSYEALVAEINAGLALNGLDTITATLGSEFQRYNSDNGVQYAGTVIVLTNTGSEELAGLGWVVNGDVPADTNVHTKIANVDPVTTTSLTQVDIELDNVGRGSQSGDFRAGNMSTGESGSQGIQQFNVTVHDDSWIRSLTTTNDWLEEVYVVNSDELKDMTENGDLTIRENSGDYYGIENVRVFDASAMTGSVDVTAVLEEGVVSKYLDVTDTATNAGADNVDFDYDLGQGNDTILLDLDVANLANAGTATREDMEVVVSGNQGDDNITVRIGTTANTVNGFTLAANTSEGTNWYENQKENANIVVDGGTGNDVIRTIGAGDVTINAGAGDDTVYTDNSGNDATSTTVQEVQTITFGDAHDLSADARLVITVAGEEIVLTQADIAAGDTDVDVATAVRDAINNSGVGISGDVSAALTSTDGQVAVTYSVGYVNGEIATNGDVAQLTVSGITTDVTMANNEATAGVVGSAAAAAIAETATIEFAAAGVAAGTTIALSNADGSVTGNITLVDTDGNGTVSQFEITQQFAATNLSQYGYTLLESNPSLGLVAIQATAAGAVGTELVTAGGAVAAYNDTVDTVVSDAGTPVDVVNGADATAATAGTAEVQELTFTGADQAGTIYLQVDLNNDSAIGDGETIAVSISAGNAASVASQVATALNAVTGLSAVVNGAQNDQVDVTFDAAVSVGDVGAITLVDGAVKSVSVAETVKGTLASDDTTATWVVNTEADANDEHVISDLDSLGQGSNELLFGAKLTVTVSGATTAGASGVTDGAAVAFENGFESTVTIGTTNNLGNAQNINQAIKAAILGETDAEGNRIADLVSVQDGPANTLVIESKIDGQFNEADLQISIEAVDVDDLTTAQKNSLITTLRDVDNNSDATYTDAELQARLDAAVEAYATNGNLDALDMAHDGSGNLLAGNESTNVSDNTITLGTGEDVVVLGTDDESNDTLVYTGTQNGHDTVVNFTQTGDAMDMLDFTAYLDAQTSVSGSAASAITAAITLNVNNVASINEVTIINSFAQDANEGQTWSALTASDLLAALNDDGSEVYGSIDESDLDVANVANLVGDSFEHIVMVENDLNDGEYKVFQLTAENDGDFTDAVLVGTIDFGNTLDNMSDANFAN